MAGTYARCPNCRSEGTGETVYRCSEGYLFYRSCMIENGKILWNVGARDARMPAMRRPLGELEG
jgi:hypothetical protein